MNNLGITSVEKAETVEEVRIKVEMDPVAVRSIALKLREHGYLEELRVGDESRFYITPRGILKVMATYT